tara:strand:- start:1822 stop:2175 length:354 start_codon:yes stop_codon:yes gene_type:complete
MDEIQQRLQDTSKNCLDAYGEWVTKKNDTKKQEDLHSAIHELRKVSSRLEIELAISERDEMASKPLPIPPHRSSKRSKGASDEGNNGDHNKAGDDKPKARRKPGKKTITIDSGNGGE